ncbi:hypothetical protein C5O19_15685 [Siphonobacter curvatus]|uniref:Uncharacterized protein n=1 Tax=Siphonobacter curvatus TaxID=2094562 RepID=A0A2S7IJL3_9BACT|nr:hypothetical protein C5O19_15685 [Siphonobacter curvatus]
MKQIISCLLVIGSCQKPDFTIDSTKLDTPSELNAKATGKCEPIQAWVGQVRGRMDQPALYETQNGVNSGFAMERVSFK